MTDVGSGFGAISKVMRMAVQSPGGGHFVVNGAPQTLGHAIDVAASQLAQAIFVAASTPATDQLWVRAFDGMLWSDWHPFTATSHA